MIGTYILRDRHPILCDDDLTWAEWFETAERRVAHTTIGDVQISTIFVGIDASFGRRIPPLLFETMVFGGALDGEQRRYATWEDADQGHQQMVELIRTQTP